MELLAQLQESLTLIDSLKTAIDKKHSSYDSVCGRGRLSLHSNLRHLNICCHEFLIVRTLVQQACTPKQTVTFLIWIASHADRLGKHIPSFSRNVHHTPNVEFVDNVDGTCKEI